MTIGHAENLSGRRFGRLVVLDLAARSRTGLVRWNVKCDCGKTLATNAGNLKRGASRSCGCFKGEHLSEAFAQFAKPENKKLSARSRLARSARVGKLVRPSNCEKCGKRGSIQGHHHKGYDRKQALDVVWLCPKCHANEPGERASREANGRAKLDSETIYRIRAKYERGRGGGRWYGPSANSYRGLAKEFGISPGHIRRIVLNLSWIDETLHGAGS